MPESALLPRGVSCFGTHNLALAEDVVQDTLLQALKHWPFDGAPENPAGWLYRVARNKAIDIVRREHSFRRFAPDLVATPLVTGGSQTAIDELLLERDIEDDALRMIYHLYPATLGELHHRLGNLQESRRHFERAIALTTSPAERRFLEGKLRACG